MEGEKVWVRLLHGGYFSMYVCVLLDLVVKIIFTLFEDDVLKIFSVALLQIHHNSLTFVRGLEMLCGGLGITPNIG